jgi:hypothetical protein
MTIQEATVDNTAPESAPATAAEVWERTVNPITKEEVRGNDPTPDAPVLPDRALVTGQLAEIYADDAPAVDPISEKLAALEESLVPKAEPEHPEVYKEIQALRAELAKRDEEAQEAERAEEREARLRTVREGFVESLRESDDFPGIVAAGFEEKVFNQIHAAQQNGEDVSEAKLLSDTEAELWQLFDVLSEVRNPTTSEEPQASEQQTPTPTLTPALSAADSAVSLEDMYAGPSDRKAAAAALWESLKL